MESVPDRAAVVTGAASGIGAATAALLASRGYVVCALDRDAPGLTRFAGEASVRVAACDIADEQQLDDALARVLPRDLPLTAAVAAAGVTFTGSLGKTTPERFDEVIHVNLRGVYLLARAVAPALEAAPGGSFVAVASELGIVGSAGLVAYGAAKAGVINMMRVLALEYGTTGVRFNAVSPGGTDTPMMAADLRARELDVAAVTAKIPLGRLARAAEIAEVIAFVASEEASFVTGTVVVADGGYTTR